MSDKPSKPFPAKLVLYSVLFVGVGSASVYLADRLIVAPREAEKRRMEDEIATQKKEIEKLEKQRAELQQFVVRLKHTERRAQIYVLDQQKAEDGLVATTLRFTEIDADGNPISEPREFTLPGEEMYFDQLVIKFEDGLIEQGDPLKGKSLILFRRVFSEKIKPEDGYALDKEGMAPEAYAAKNAPSDFEKDLWTRFWELARDPKLAKEKGIRAMHGEAVYQKVQKDKVYVLEVRATGEVTLRPPLSIKKTGDAATSEAQKETAPE